MGFAYSHVRNARAHTHTRGGDTVAADKSLNPQYRKFSEEYIKCWNATAAAIAAGYSPKNAANQGMTLLRRPDVKAYIYARLEEVAASTNEVLAF